MKVLAITLIVHTPDPVTGQQKPTTDRFREVIGNALLAGAPVLPREIPAPPWPGETVADPALAGSAI
jgi:hypothetical protein